MQQTSFKMAALSSLFIFLGLVSRDLNAHHQRLTFNSVPLKTRTFSALATDILYAEPTLTIRRIQ
jgi:hypothetical protein